ncbi:MAG: hypothetical protein IKC28_09720 [Clostridia bacterium]|nr:hypothetical protein [Clostridia bacterium]
MMKCRKVYAWLTTCFSKKVLLVVIASVVALSGAASGTLAWLIDQTDEITNTFTFGDINITLTETDSKLDGDNDPKTNQYKMMPGATIAKDPTVTVLAGSEDCWLFVKLEKSDDFNKFLSYEMDDGWNDLNGNPGVYYREVEADTEDQQYSVLKDNQISVDESVTKEQIDELKTESNTNYPTLTITAYAVQHDSTIDTLDTAGEAWVLINTQNSEGTP